MVVLLRTFLRPLLFFSFGRERGGTSEMRHILSDCCCCLFCFFIFVKECDSASTFVRDTLDCFGKKKMKKLASILICI